MNKLKLSIVICGTIIMIIVMAYTGKNLNTNSTPLGILNLEFAYNQQKADTILEAWQPAQGVNRIDEAIVNTYWDFLFMFFYSALFFLVTSWLYKKHSFGFLKSVSALAVKISLLIPLLDIVENTFMLAVLKNNYLTWGLPIMVTASTIKWILVLLIIIYCLASFIHLAIKKIK